VRKSSLTSFGVQFSRRAERIVQESQIPRASVTCEYNQIKTELSLIKKWYMSCNSQILKLKPEEILIHVHTSYQNWGNSWVSRGGRTNSSNSDLISMNMASKVVS
jgi:hypothetical protein